VLKRISGSKGKEVAKGWRRLPNDDPHNLKASSYTFNIKIKQDRSGRACSMSG
jgi:hypothetical protein